MPQDWTIAMDDALRGTLTRCTQCGRDATTGVFSIYDACGGPNVAVSQCLACRTRDPERRMLRGLLAARYAR